MPRIRQLPNKPLVEAILEIRWRFSEQFGDPHYSVFVGALYERVKSQYPFHEALPTSMIPQPAIPHIAQHRFRVAKSKWPLVQVGPGLVTLNDTDNYTWQDFGERAKTLAVHLFDSYPEPSDLAIDSLILRYIDAVPFDYRKKDLLEFLRDKLKTGVTLPPTLFADVPVDPLPTGLNLHTAFSVTSPNGTMTLRFRSGTHSNQPALVWETILQSTGDSVPEMPAGFPEWIEAAHTLTDDWFFKLIEGDLERRFASEE